MKSIGLASMMITMPERTPIQTLTFTAQLLVSAKMDGRSIQHSIESLARQAIQANMPAAPYVVTHLLTDIRIRMKNVTLQSLMFRIVHLLASVSKGMK